MLHLVLEPGECVPHFYQAAIGAAATALGTALRHLAQAAEGASLGLERSIPAASGQTPGGNKCGGRPGGNTLQHAGRN
jgi:Spy/CpxP family protein refolding chaperone